MPNQIDKQSLIDIEDTTKRLSNPFTYFFFVVRITWMFWKFCFINPGFASVPTLVQCKAIEGAKRHGPNIWSDWEINGQLNEEFMDLFGWGSLYFKKIKTLFWK